MSNFYWSMMNTMHVLDSLEKERKINELEQKIEASSNKKSQYHTDTIRPSTLTIWNYIINTYGNFTAQDIAKDLNMNIKAVNGTITSLQKKGWVIREQIGSNKFIKLTKAGRTEGIPFMLEKYNEED